MKGVHVSLAALLILILSYHKVFATFTITKVAFVTSSNQWNNGNDGIVQVTVLDSTTSRSTTGVVCKIGIQNDAAAAFCYQLGFVPSGVIYQSAKTSSVTSSVIVQNVKCTGQVATNPSSYDISRCSFSTPATGCTTANALAVQCGAKRATTPATTVAPNLATLAPVDCTAGSTTVRLVNGTATSGRVEIQRGGSWGTICNIGFYQNAAKVICKMACQNSNYARAVVGNYAGGTGTIWFSDLTCPANANSTNDCTHSGWGTPKAACIHTMDARVECAQSTAVTAQVPNPTVSCSEATATVTFNRTTNADLTATNLQLSNPNTFTVANCAFKVTVKTATVDATFAFTQCGGTTTFNTTSTIYRNNLLRLYFATSGIISNTNYTIPIVCVVPKTNQGNGGNLSPQVVTVPPKTSVDSLKLTINFYKDAAFTQIIPASSTIVIGSSIYVRVQETAKLANNKMAVRNCWATPTNVRTSTTRRNLIVNGCPQTTSSVTPLQSIDAMTQSFSFTAFLFSGSTTLYVHCDTITCSTTDTSASCLRQCVTSGRKKRSIEEEFQKFLAKMGRTFKSVDHGPFYMKEAGIGHANVFHPSIFLVILSSILRML